MQILKPLFSVLYVASACTTPYILMSRANRYDTLMISFPIKID